MSMLAGMLTRVSRRVRLVGEEGRKRMGLGLGVGFRAGSGGERTGGPKGVVVGGSGEREVLLGREVVVAVSSAQGSLVGSLVGREVVVSVSSAQGEGAGREAVSAAKRERRMMRRV